MNQDIEPATLAKICGFETTDLRNWRAKGHANDLGQRIGRARFFNDAEAAEIFVARFVSKITDLRFAFDYAKDRRWVFEGLSDGRDVVSGGGDFIDTISLDPSNPISGASGVTGAPPERVAFESPYAALLVINISELWRECMKRRSEVMGPVD